MRNKGSMPLKEKNNQMSGRNGGGPPNRVKTGPAYGGKKKRAAMKKVVMALLVAGILALSSAAPLVSGVSVAWADGDGGSE